MKMDNVAIVQQAVPESLAAKINEHYFAAHAHQKKALDFAFDVIDDVDSDDMAQSYSEAVLAMLEKDRMSALAQGRKVLLSFRHEGALKVQRDALLPAVTSDAQIDAVAESMMGEWQTLAAKELDVAQPRLQSEVAHLSLILCSWDDKRDFFFSAATEPRPFAEMWAANLALAAETLAANAGADAA